MSGSLLPNQTAINKEETFFAVSANGGGGNIPIVVAGTLDRILFPIPDETFYTITSFQCPPNLVNGKYIVTATYNVDSGGGGDGGTVICQINEGASGLYINNRGSWFDAIRFINVTNVFTFPYSATNGDDYPNFQFNIENGSSSGDGIVYLSYTIIFYPDSFN